MRELAFQMPRNIDDTDSLTALNPQKAEVPRVSLAAALNYTYLFSRTVRLISVRIRAVNSDSRFS